MPIPFTIGILSPLLGNFYFGQLLLGIQQAAAQTGARTIAIQTRDAWAPHAEYGRSHSFTHQFAWAHVDGWIVITDAVSPDYIQAIQKTGKPVVLLSWHAPSLDCHSVLPDNHGGTQQLVQHLIEHGHKRIAFTGFLDHVDIRERYEGYQAALVAHGITPDPDLCFPILDNQTRGGHDAATSLLAAGVPCTAVVAGTDLNALALITALQKAGLRVPEDVAVVGFDDVEVAQYVVPALTTVRQSFSETGREAGQLLLAQLAGEQHPTVIHRIPCTLITRRSCGCTQSSEVHPVAHNTLNSDNWQAGLAVDLVGLLLAPAPLAPNAVAGEIWPGVSTLIESASAAITGEPGPSDQALAHAWDQAIALNSDLRTLRSVLTHLRELGLPQIPAADAAARSRFELFADTALSELLHARMRDELNRNAHFESVINENYAITDAILVGTLEHVAQLTWLALTSASQGCLGLWNPTQTGLTIAGLFGDVDQAPSLGSLLAPDHFPPEGLLQAPVQSADNELLMLFPARTPQRDWGILAVVGPIEASLESGRSIFSQTTALLTMLLAREELLQSQAAQQSALQLAYDRERMLAETIRAMGVPIIPLLPQVLLIPLIGTIDTARAQQLIDVALQAISQHHASEVLLDLTGVPLVDTQVAGTLIHLARAAALLGAQVLLVGVSPEIAQSLVSLAIDLNAISTYASLAAALERLLARRNHIGRSAPRQAIL